MHIGRIVEEHAPGESRMAKKLQDWLENDVQPYQDKSDRAFSHSRCVRAPLVLCRVAPEWGLFANGRASLRVVALAMLVAIPGEMWFGAVLGTGDTLAALGIEFVLTATMLGIAYLTAMPLGWPVEWVWLSLPIAWAVVLFISYLWMRSRMWQRVHI